MIVNDTSGWGARRKGSREMSFSSSCIFLYANSVIAGFLWNNPKKKEKGYDT